MPESSFDVIVLGAGPTGENVAARAVQGGLTAAIVESELVGGECSYWACIPSKALLRSSAALEAARRVDGSREAITGSLNAQAVFARRTRFTNGWKDESQAKWLAKAGITLVRGQGRLAGERKVEVRSPDGATLLTARHAVAICTGTVPAAPPIPGLAEAKPWTNRQATRADRVPPRLAILGGGPVACEMASAWRALGSEVTVLERAASLLERMEPFVGERLADAFRQRGIVVHTRADTTRVQRSPANAALQVWFRQAGAPHDLRLEADQILVATGRAPNTRDVGLDTIHLQPGQWLEVDDSCRVKAVAAGWLYAAGDVNHRALLTHMGKYQARACGDAIVARATGDLRTTPPDWSRWAATADHRAVPQVIFTDPEIASLGLTEAQARQAGLRVRTVEYEIGSVSGAQLTADGYQGHAKMVVDEERRVILGVTFIGQDVAELIHAGTVAVVGEVPLDRLWHAVPSFPTISEIWLRLLETYGL
ncbi:MAG TPA: NAD(P)/FAD-dependent oxidoreductase [Bryobacteraceae bacterium]|nr:NAD(P)/FAD-dependent oxidoreductase [Bryobacteraceae bacterium]